MTDDGGIGRLQKRLAALPRAVVSDVQPAVVKSAEEMADLMRRLAPKDTGDLAASIAVTPAGSVTPAYSQPGGSMTVPANAAAITVGNEDVRYPHLVEYGTAKAHAQPFFWPAFRLKRTEAVRAIRRAVGKAVKAGWGGGP